MRAPKTPLPWVDDSLVGLMPCVCDSEGRPLAEFNESEDAWYARHAANVLPVVVEALRALVEEVDESDPLYAGVAGTEPMSLARAALLKAEGGE